MNNLAMKILFLVFLATAAVSCGGNKEPQSQQKDSVNLLVYCDEAIYKLVVPPCMKFDSLTGVRLQLTKSRAFDAMAKLLSGDARAIILGSDFNYREDSLINAYNVKSLVKLPLADDALVFFVRYDVNLDTLTDSQLKEVLNSTTPNLRKYYPKLKKEPLFIVNDNLSSEYENLVKYLTNGKQPSLQAVKYMNSPDSVIRYVIGHPGDIGIGYLSQVLGVPDVKPLDIGFTDSTGKYIYPHKVHQANLVLNFYPYIVHHYVYLFDDRNEFALKMARFLTKNEVAQRFFKDAGIVPAYAEIKLVPSE